MKDRKSMIKTTVTLGLFTAISIIMTVTPLGTIRLFWTEATIAHLPVVILAVLGGPLLGAAGGLILGLISMIYCIMNPVMLNVYIANPLVSIPARVLIGFLAGLVYKCMNKAFVKGERKGVKDAASIAVSAALGSLANTAGVLGMLYLLYGRRIAAELMELNTDTEQWRTIVLTALLGIATSQGLMEMALVAVVTVIVVKALRRAGYKQ